MKKNMSAIDKLSSLKINIDQRPQEENKGMAIEIVNEDTKVIDTEEVKRVITPEKEEEVKIVDELEPSIHNPLDEIKSKLDNNHKITMDLINRNTESISDLKGTINTVGNRLIRYRRNSKKVSYISYFSTLILLILICVSFLYMIGENSRLEKKINKLEDYCSYLNNNIADIADVSNNASEEVSTETVVTQQDTYKPDNTLEDNSSDSSSEEASTVDGEIENAIGVDEEEKKTEIVKVESTENMGDLTFEGYFEKVSYSTNSDGSKRYEVLISEVDDPNHIYTLKADSIKSDSKKEIRQYEIISDIADALIGTNYACQFTLSKERVTGTDSNGNEVTDYRYYITNYKGLRR